MRAVPSAGALLRFSRPHTIIGTTVSILSVSWVAWRDAVAEAAAVSSSPSSSHSSSPSWAAFWGGLAAALVPSLLMNIYIVGLNQVYDVEIDRVNKPTLPLASGEMSHAQAVCIVAVSAVLAMALGSVPGCPDLWWALFGSLVLGTAYSADLPGLRWKRSPALAAFCVFVVRGVIVQVGFYRHMRNALSSGADTVRGGMLLVDWSDASCAEGAQRGMLPAAVAAAWAAEATGRSRGGLAMGTGRTVPFACAFMVLFGVVIALFKDLPDDKGDRQHGIASLTVRLGRAAVFRLCVFLLLACYALGLGMALTDPEPARGALAALLHVAPALALVAHAQTVDTQKHRDIARTYLRVWALFYLEYLAIPFVH